VLHRSTPPSDSTKNVAKLRAYSKLGGGRNGKSSVLLGCQNVAPAYQASVDAIYYWQDVPCEQFSGESARARRSFASHKPPKPSPFIALEIGAQYRLQV
jgi:hypothetical protein